MGVRPVAVVSLLGSDGEHGGEDAAFDGIGNASADVVASGA